MIEQILNTYYQTVRQSSLFRSFYDGYDDYRNAPLVEKKELIHLLNTRFDLHQETQGDMARCTRPLHRLAKAACLCVYSA